MPPSVRLPRADGTVASYVLREPVHWPAPAGPIRSRVAYAAAHVVCDPLADCDPFSHGPLDWEATLAYRHYLWSFELAVAPPSVATNRLPSVPKVGPAAPATFAPLASHWVTRFASLERSIA